MVLSPRALVTIARREVERGGLGPPNIGGEVGGGSGKMFGHEIRSPGKKVRIETDLPTESVVCRPVAGYIMPLSRP